MVRKNMEQEYCMVNLETNICDNISIWDGNPQTWTPPPNYLMLPTATTPAKVWKLVGEVYEFTVEIGVGAIGFIWDGEYLITDQPQPTPVIQPVTNGLQEA
jgi:hypothetical protein